jgi:hypothetical protein
MSDEIKDQEEVEVAEDEEVEAHKGPHKLANDEGDGDDFEAHKGHLRV